MMMTTMMMNYVQNNMFVAKITIFDALIIKIIRYHRFVLNSSIVQFKIHPFFNYDSAVAHISIILTMVFKTIAMASASWFAEYGLSRGGTWMNKARPALQWRAL